MVDTGAAEGAADSIGAADRKNHRAREVVVGFASAGGEAVVVADNCIDHCRPSSPRAEKVAAFLRAVAAFAPCCHCQLDP